MPPYSHIQLPNSLVFFGTSHSPLRTTISAWNTVEKYFTNQSFPPNQLIPQKLNYGQFHKKPGYGQTDRQPMLTVL